jgi:adenine-specific DNA-methyltransferase
MKGFVPTPNEVVDRMVALLFQSRLPTANDRLLDPGCGTGQFIDGVIRWCNSRSLPLPSITGIEVDPKHIPTLVAKYAGVPEVEIQNRDFLVGSKSKFDFIVGNPPYVPITGLNESEKLRYRASYVTARGRFDLYVLFFEQALRSLVPMGRLVFITPEKYLYVESAGKLRELLATKHVEAIHLASEDTFGALVTYPTITVVNGADGAGTTFTQRDGASALVELPRGVDSWLPVLLRSQEAPAKYCLADYCLRISPGIATGADSVFVRSIDDVHPNLSIYGRPTISGRELRPGDDRLRPRSVMLTPYDDEGRLLPEDRLGPLREYLCETDNERRLRQRTCVAHKAWYAFHETPDLPDILRPKILCKDICQTPHFVADYEGQIVPRHSVYYIVPEDPGLIQPLLTYLRSEAATRWLLQNCQRAAKGAFRIQSRVLQRLPVPESVVNPAARLRVAAGTQLALSV